MFYLISKHDKIRKGKVELMFSKTIQVKKLFSEDTNSQEILSNEAAQIVTIFKEILITSLNILKLDKRQIFLRTLSVYQLAISICSNQVISNSLKLNFRLPKTQHSTLKWLRIPNFCTDEEDIIVCYHLRLSRHTGGPIDCG